MRFRLLNLSYKEIRWKLLQPMFDDFKYLFAYTVPLATFFSIFSDGILTFITPIYTFIFIPTLEAILKERETKTIYSEKQIQNKLTNKIFDYLLYGNIPMVFILLISGI